MAGIEALGASCWVCVVAGNVATFDLAHVAACAICFVAVVDKGDVARTILDGQHCS